MKKRTTGVVFALLGVLLLILACAPAASPNGEEPVPTPEAEPVIIGLFAPLMTHLGERQLEGAELAVDQINAAGGISVGGVGRPIKLVVEDSNEISSVPDAVAAIERLQSRNRPQMVCGCIKSEAAFAVMDRTAADKTILLTVGTGAMELPVRVKEDYETYKYWFRVMPINSLELAMSLVPFVNYGGEILREALGLEPDATLKVAVVVEKGEAGEHMYQLLHASLPKLGMEEVGAWRPAGDATDLSGECSAIAASGAQMIAGWFYGPAGLPFAKTWAELEVPAAYFGTNAAAQSNDYWDATLGRGNYMTSSHAWFARTEITPKTIPFWDAYLEKTEGTFPAHVSATYDAIYIYKDAAEMADSFDPDVIVSTMEENEFVGAMGKFKWHGMDTDYPHDLTVAPGYAFPIGIQWVDGEHRCVWPYEFMGVTYEGTKKVEIAPWVIDYWKGKL